MAGFENKQTMADVSKIEADEKKLLLKKLRPKADKPEVAEEIVRLQNEYVDIKRANKVNFDEEKTDNFDENDPLGGAYNVDKNNTEKTPDNAISKDPKETTAFEDFTNSIRDKNKKSDKTEIPKSDKDPKETKESSVKETNAFEDFINKTREKDGKPGKTEKPKAAEEIKGETDPELNSLMKEVEAARAKYAAQDYEADKKKGWLKRILGRGTDNMQIDSVMAAHDNYKDKMRELSDYQVAGLKNAKPDGVGFDKGAGDLMKYFDTTEKTNLYEARTTARTQAWEGKFGGKLMGKAGDFVNWYRKQNAWGKTALGLGLGFSGLGAAAIGTIGLRALGGAAYGTGVTAWMEGRHRKNEAVQADKQRGEFMRQLEGVEMENKFNDLSSRLDAEMDTYHKSLLNEKVQARNRKLVGALVGVVVGSGAMSWLLGKSFNVIGDKWHSLFGGAADHVDKVKAPIGGGAHPVENHISGAGAAHVNHGPEVAPKAPLGHGPSVHHTETTGHHNPLEKGAIPKSHEIAHGGATEAGVEAKKAALERLKAVGPSPELVDANAKIELLKKTLGQTDKELLLARMSHDPMALQMGDIHGALTPDQESKMPVEAVSRIKKLLADYVRDQKELVSANEKLGKALKESAAKSLQHLHGNVGVWRR